MTWNDPVVLGPGIGATLLKDFKPKEGHSATGSGRTVDVGRQRDDGHQAVPAIEDIAVGITGEFAGQAGSVVVIRSSRI